MISGPMTGASHSVEVPRTAILDTMCSVEAIVSVWGAPIRTVTENASFVMLDGKIFKHAH